MLGKDAVTHGLGDLAATKIVAFYADDGVLSARCPEWLQSSFTTPMGLFEWVSLAMNAQITKVMLCIPKKIRVSFSVEVYNDSCLGASNHATRKHLQVECTICHQSMQAASLQSHWKCNMMSIHCLFSTMSLTVCAPPSHPGTRQVYSPVAMSSLAWKIVSCHSRLSSRLRTNDQ